MDVRLGPSITYIGIFLAFSDTPLECTPLYCKHQLSDCFWNMGPWKVLNDSKLIINDQGSCSDSFRIHVKSFRTFRGPLSLQKINWHRTPFWKHGMYMLQALVEAYIFFLTSRQFKISMVTNATSFCCYCGNHTKHRNQVLRACSRIEDIKVLGYSKQLMSRTASTLRTEVAETYLSCLRS